MKGQRTKFPLKRTNRRPVIAISQAIETATAEPRRGRLTPLRPTRERYGLAVTGLGETFRSRSLGCNTDPHPAGLPMAAAVAIARQFPDPITAVRGRPHQAATSPRRTATTRYKHRSDELVEMSTRRYLGRFPAEVGAPTLLFEASRSLPPRRDFPRSSRVRSAGRKVEPSPRLPGRPGRE